MSTTCPSPPEDAIDARVAAARLACRPFASEYSFEHRFLDVDGGALHYVDEGPRDGSPILFLHGNPTWSFLWRRLITALSDRHRCVALDHIGCGLSDKPQDWPYTLEAHIANVERLVLELDLHDVTLALHDWGGAIGMGLARRHPERIARLIVTNTAAFRSKRIPLRISLCRTPALGSVLVRRLNAFAGMAPRMAVARRGGLNPVVRRGYLTPYDSYANRIATWRFVKDIPLRPDHPSWAELGRIEESLSEFADRPTCIVWGERDFCFTPHFREEWERRFPRAVVHAVANAGHLVLEDAPRESEQWIRSFLDETEDDLRVRRRR